MVRSCRDEKSRRTVRHEIRDAADGRADHRQRRRHRFQEDERQPRSGGQRECITGGENALDVRTCPCHVHVCVFRAPGDPRSERLVFRRLSDDDEAPTPAQQGGIASTKAA